MSSELHTFRYVVERPSDGTVGRVTKVICHGSLVNQTSADLKDAVKLLIADGGEITLDFKDVSFIDSLGLGTLVGLKVSALGKNDCSLEVKDLSPRVKELLHMTNLAGLFKLPAA